MKFTLGEQPDWAGEEAVIDPPTGFVEALLSSPPARSLLSRDYCVMPLSNADVDVYSAFHSDWEEFCALSEGEKRGYAQLQFEPGLHSPNQFHGFSVVQGLKEQFMCRALGAGMEGVVETPALIAKNGFALFERLDDICRQLCEQAMQIMGGVDSSRVEEILDPFGDDGEFLPPGYISSSILDCFHYFNNSGDGEFANKKDLDEHFHNNHAMHTDSGLATLVVCTDSPGLEILDPELGHWVSIEQLIHEYARARNVSHRKFAIVFFGDSLDYLVKDLRNSQHPPTHRIPKACYHRVARSDGAGPRFSVVFKQRTAPLATAARYQEDYPLSLVQLESVQKAGCRNWKLPDAVVVVVPEATQASSEPSQETSSSSSWIAITLGVSLVAVLVGFVLLKERQQK